MTRDTIQPAENPDANERRFLRDCRRYNLELLNRENIVPPCMGYSREEPQEGE